MARLPRIASFSLDIDDWYSCHTSDDEANQAVVERNSVITFYTVPGALSPPDSPRLGDADDALEQLVAEPYGDPRLQHDHPELDDAEVPAQKRTRSNGSGLPPLPPLTSVATPVIKTKHASRQGSHRRGPHRSATSGSTGSTDGSSHATGLPSAPGNSIRVFLTVQPDGSYVHVNILPAVFCFGNVVLPMRPVSVSNDFSAIAFKDQSKVKPGMESGKERKSGGFPGAFLLQRIFSGFRTSVGGASKQVAALPPASAQELGSELLQAAKQATVAQLAAAPNTVVAAYMQTAPANAPAAGLATSNDGTAAVAAIHNSLGGAAAISPVKPVPSPRDTVFAPPQLELPERDQVPASMAVDGGREPASPPAPQASSGVSSLQQSLESAPGIAALALLEGLAEDAATAGHNVENQQTLLSVQPAGPAPILAPFAGYDMLAVDAEACPELPIDGDGSLPTPTLEKCDSPVVTPTAAAVKAFAAAGAIGTYGPPEAPSSSSSASPSVVVITEAEGGSPGTVSKKAYGTVAQLVKEIAPDFRDSNMASIVASSLPPTEEQARPSTTPSPMSGNDSAVQTVNAAEPLATVSPGRPVSGMPAAATSTSRTAAVAARSAVEMLPAAGRADIMTTAGANATAADTTSPRAASRAAYGTVANLVKKMVPGYRDSVTASMMANSPPRGQEQAQPAAGPSQAVPCMAAAPTPADGGGVTVQQASSFAETGSVASVPTSPAADFLLTATTRDTNAAVVNTASPRAASKAAYGTVANLVKKMVPSFKDSIAGSIMVSSPPRAQQRGTMYVHGSPSLPPEDGSAATAINAPGAHAESSCAAEQVPACANGATGTGADRLAATCLLPADGSSAALLAGGAVAAATAADTASPHAASRAAYGTVAQLVKKMVPTFRDSVTASTAASSSPRRLEQPQVAASMSSERGQVQSAAEAFAQPSGVTAEPQASAALANSEAAVPGPEQQVFTPESGTLGGQAPLIMFIFGQERPTSVRRSSSKSMRAAAAPLAGDTAAPQGDADGRKRKADNTGLPSAKLLSLHSKGVMDAEQPPTGPQTEPHAFSASTVATSMTSPKPASPLSNPPPAADGALAGQRKTEALPQPWTAATESPPERNGEVGPSTQADVMAPLPSDALESVSQLVVTPASPGLQAVALQPAWTKDGVVGPGAATLDTLSPTGAQVQEGKELPVPGPEPQPFSGGCQVAPAKSVKAKKGGFLAYFSCFRA